MKRSGAVVLTLLIVLLLVANSRDFFFRQPYYEVWDSAANSLSVLRAKHFGQLYGPYSRWGFYHPGPTLFYVQALGEWLFHDTLHWTPTPLPAQTLAHAFVMSGFFVAALLVFSRWQPAGRPRRWFLCAALIVASLHFSATGGIPSYDVLRGPTAFLSLWSAHALVLPFLCLLTAGTSVAAGRGEDLPILALAGGYLLQLHVAQPMFVGPMFAVGYAGLLWQAGRRAWRRFPRAHAAAGLILLFFAAPFLIDFCQGSQSNAAAILRHLHEYDTHKPLERAWFYLLMFGTYTAYHPSDNEFAAYDHAGMLAFLRAHAVLCAVWGTVAGLAGWAWLAGMRARGSEGARFRAWAAGLLCLSVGLTLRWNVRQDAQMFYFNSWFTFGIYYFGALIALAVVCAWLPPDATPRLAWRERVAGGLAILAVASWRADALRLADPSPAATRAMHEDIRRLEAAAGAAERPDGPGRPIRMLRFEYDTSPVAAAVAIQLARDGLPFATENGWHAYFGEDRSWGNLPPSAIEAGRVQTWRFAHGPATDPASVHVTTVPYLLGFFHEGDDTQISVTDPWLDPGAPGGAAISFGPGSGTQRYLVGGWFTSDEGRTWIDDPRAMLGFRAPPLPGAGGAVEIVLAGLVSVLAPADTPATQRLRVWLDGEPLGAPATFGPHPTDLVYRVPAEPWNRRADAGHHLLIELPDAAVPPAPNALGTREERPPIGVGLSEVCLRWVAAAGP